MYSVLAFRLARIAAVKRRPARWTSDESGLGGRSELAVSQNTDG